MAEKIELRIEGKDLASKELKKVDASLGKTEKSAGKLGKKFTGLKKSLKGVGAAGKEAFGAISAAAAGVAGAAILFPVKAAMDFQKAMSGVKAVTTGAAENFDALRMKAKELGSTTKFTATEAAAGMEMLGRAGMSAGDVIKSIGPALTLAAAGGIELAEAADIATNIMGGFGLAAEDMDHVVDIMANTTASANINITEMGESMKMASAAAKTLGVPIEEVAAAIGVLHDKGIKGTMAGTGLAGTMAKLAAQTPQAQKAMVKLGFEVTKNADGTLDFTKTMTDFGAKMEAVTDRTERLAIANKIFGLEAGKAAITIATNMGRVKELTAANIAAEGAAKTMAKVLQDNLAGAWILLKSAIEGFMVEVVERLLPALQWMIETITSVVSWLTQMHARLGPLAGIIDAVGLALLAAVIILGTFSAAWVLLAGPITAVLGLLGGAGLIGVLTTIGSILVPLIAVIAAFYAGWKLGKLIDINKLLDLMKAGLEWVKATLWAVGVAAAGVWLSIAAGVRSAAESIKGAFTAAFDFIAAKIEAMKAKVKSLIAAAKSALTGGSSKDEKKATGGRVGLAGGGRLAGFGGGDKVRALLERGEFVIRKEAVRNYGARFFDSLNSMTLPQPVGYQTGGAVAAGGGGMNVDMPVNIRASGSDAANMERMFRNEIIPRLKTALRNNTGSLKTSFQRTMR